MIGLLMLLVTPALAHADFTGDRCTANRRLL